MRLGLVPRGHLVKPGLKPDGGLGVGHGSVGAATACADQRRDREDQRLGWMVAEAVVVDLRKARSGTGARPRPYRPRRSRAGRAALGRGSQRRASQTRRHGRHPPAAAEPPRGPRKGDGTRHRSGGTGTAMGCRSPRSSSPAWTSSLILMAPSRAAPEARMMRAAARHHLVAWSVRGLELVEGDPGPPLHLAAVALGEGDRGARKAELWRSGQLILREVGEPATDRCVPPAGYVGRRVAPDQARRPTRDRPTRSHGGTARSTSPRSRNHSLARAWSPDCDRGVEPAQLGPQHLPEHRMVSIDLIAPVEGDDQEVRANEPAQHIGGPGPLQDRVADVAG